MNLAERLAQLSGVFNRANPKLTAEQYLTALKITADEALEEAAKKAERGGYPNDFDKGSSENLAIRAARNEIAKAIRGMKSGSQK